MCWLFRACSAVTFKAEQQRCLLYQLGEDLKAYRTVREPGSLAVDMRKAKMDHTKIRLYGCDNRPCSETEMCAPVKSIASYVCISQMSVFCREDPPHIPNSEAHPDGVSSIIYTCAHGFFQRDTSHMTTCDRNTGVWSDVDVKCTFVDCGAPSSLHGAVATISSTTVNSEAN
ncbi:hypothetical protein PoB_000033000 [Plakobranchus ocellatus]|uniref:Sushi domain-containing protein n=1 Tax=Plakobranchus ocellatus TaxID=259542 RepID=A0AAV3XTQ0_9GAST|nr:hypothetical protein PoB_000033000 [Plakobranchus ocellatus]